MEASALTLQHIPSRLENRPGAPVPQVHPERPQVRVGGASPEGNIEAQDGEHDGEVAQHPH